MKFPSNHPDLFCTQPWRLIVITTLVGLGAVDPVRAASATTNASVSELKSLSLEELMHVSVITATRVATDPFDLPFFTQALTQRDYERLLPATLPDWLQEVPGIMVQKTANGQGSPIIRGFTGFRTAMLIDGVRLNNSTFRDGPNQYWNTVDPLSVSRLEVVQGPGSVLYGSDAVGGTVNALTLDPGSPGPGLDWRGRTFVRASSAEESLTTRAETSGPLGDRAALQLGGTWKEFGDLRGGKDVGVQPKTGYGEYDFDAKFHYLLWPNVKLTLAHQTISQNDVWRTHSTIYGIDWEGLARGSDLQRSLDQRRHLTYVQLHAEDLPGFIEKASFNLSDHIQDETQYRVRNNRRRDLAEVDVNTLGTWLQLESPSPLGRWVYGTTFYHDWVSSHSRTYNADGSLQSVAIQGPVADESTYDLVGLFVQDNLPPLGPLEVIFRGRYEHIEAQAGRIQDPVTGQPYSYSKNWDSVVGGARAIVHLDREDHWNLYAAAGQSFRAPNLSDLTRFDTAASGQIETPSTTVKPEQFMTYEGGVKARYSRWEMEACYFYTDMRNLIVRTPTGRMINGAAEVTKQNAGEGFVHGVELNTHLHLHEQLTLNAAFSWLDGESATFPTSNPDFKVNEPVSRLMPTTALLSLHWEHPKVKFWGELQCQLAARQDQLASLDLADTQRIPPGGTPGYTLWNLRAGWRASEKFSLSAAVENLTDVDYRIHGSGVNRAGLNFVLGADVRF
jgi:hemoglobin/transferrin/lactoferrin receptor protein